MNNRSGTVKEYTQNFLVDEPKLRKIVDVVRDQSKRLSYGTYIEFYIERENDVFYTTRLLDEVLQDDNSIGQSIRIFTIGLYKSEPDQQKEQKLPGEPKPIAYIAFTPHKETKVRFSAMCEIRDWTLLTADEIGTQIKRNLTTRSLSLFRNADYLVALLIAWIGTIIGFWIFQRASSLNLASIDINAMTSNQQIAKILEIMIRRDSYPAYILPASWYGAYFLGLIFALTRPISRLIGKSRTSFFCWGDMIQVHDKIEKRNTLLRWSLGIALVVSIVGSIIGTIIILGLFQ